MKAASSEAIRICFKALEDKSLEEEIIEENFRYFQLNGLFIIQRLLRRCEKSWEALEKEIPSTNVKQFNLGKRIGRGGFGEVWFGTLKRKTGLLTSEKIEVAIKRLYAADDAKIRMEISSYRFYFNFSFSFQLESSNTKICYNRLVGRKLILTLLSF